MMQFLTDEGAIPTPEEEETREQVIRELKKVLGHGDSRLKKLGTAGMCVGVEFLNSCVFSACSRRL